MNYTEEEVSLHNVEGDCWIIINKDVYDITEFLDDHPGGRSILLKFGGTDVTEYFKELHNIDIIDTIAKKYLIGHI